MLSSIPNLFLTQESVKISRENFPDLKRISPLQKVKKETTDFIEFYLLYSPRNHDLLMACDKSVQPMSLGLQKSCWPHNSPATLCPVKGPHNSW